MTAVSGNSFSKCHDRRRKQLQLYSTAVISAAVLLLFAGCGNISSVSSEDSLQTEDMSVTDVPELTEDELALYVSEDGYVDPAAYGAVGDGVTDDTAAIQMAIDSGYNVRLNDTTYLIAADQYLSVSDKTDFHMEGGTIHKEASPSNIQLFVLKDCTDCSFSSMYIYSEFEYTDILVPKNHFRPSETKNSNVLAFSGTGNSGILFQNNSFSYMAADYWFNATDDAFWTDITVDGWTSSTSLMPMYTQCLTGLTVRNASVSLNEGCGDGDHCIYVCYRTSDVLIENSVFTGNDNDLLNGAVVVLTFHGGDEDKDTQPKNIVIDNCRIQALSGRALYCEEGTDLTITNTSVTQYSSSSGDAVTGHEKTPVFGYGSFTFLNCTLQAENAVFEGMPELKLTGCTVDGGTLEALITGVASLSAEVTSFTVDGGSVLYMNESSHPVHVYSDCSFVKTGDTLKYLFSDRSANGSITLSGCTVDLGENWFAYNGSGKDVSSFVLENTTLVNSLGMDMRDS